MSRVYKIRFREIFAVLALTICLSFGEARAQPCEPPGTATGSILGMQVPQEIMNVWRVVQSVWSAFSTFIGAVSTAVSTISFFQHAAQNPTCLVMTTCEQQFFQQLGGTVTGAATMQSAIIGKAADYKSSSAYSLQLQTTQAQMAVQNGVGTSGANNSLAYMNNNLCVAATTAAGGAQTGQFVASYVSEDPWAGSNCQSGISGSASSQAAQTYPGKPSTSYPYNPSVNPAGGCNLDSTQILQKLYTGTYAFDKLPGFAKDSDENIGYLLNQFVFSTANTPSDQNAMDQFSDYIVGLPVQNPHVPSRSTDPVAIQSQIAFKEKNTFQGLVAMPLAFIEGEHLGTLTNNAPNIQDIFKAANYPVNVNTSAAAPNGQISKASLLKATFQLVGNDVNNFTGIGSMVSTKALQYIAGAMALGNWMDYERYQVEQRDLLVEDAILALRTRRANFMQEP